MIEAAEAEGRIEPGRTTIVEATSGNTGIALAFVCAAKGYDLILTLPQGMSREREGLLRLYGAQVHVTESLGGMNEAVAAAQALARDSDVWLPDQFSNPANPEAHYRATGPEIWAAMDGQVDCLVAGVGTGGTLTGAGRFLKERNPACRIVAVEPASSPVLSGGRAGPAQDPGHRRRLRPAGARPRARRRDRLRRRRGRARDGAARRAPRGRARRHLLRRRAVGRDGDRQARRRGGPDRGRAARLRASATCRRRSSPPSPRPRAHEPARARRRRGRARGSGRCTARSTGSSWRATCWPATRSATRRTARCGSTARPGVERDHPKPLPTVYVIQGYTGQLDMWANRVPFEPTFLERLDHLFAPATARTRSSCSSTRGRATAARSSSTRARPGRT